MSSQDPTPAALGPLLVGVASSAVIAAVAAAIVKKKSAGAIGGTADTNRAPVTVALKPGEAGDANAEPSSHIIRHKNAASGLLSKPISAIKGFELRSLADVLPYARAHHPHRRALGRRKLVRTHSETKVVTKVVDGKEVQQAKTWTYFEMGPYEWLSAEEACVTAGRLGAGLAHLGLRARADRLCIYAGTSRDWLLMAHACFAQNITITTAYDTLGADGLAYSLNEAEVSAVFCNESHLATVLDTVPRVADHLRLIIYDGELSAPAAERVRAASAAHDCLRILPLDYVLAEGILHPKERAEPDAEDLACIMYTSGSTGVPKGVQLTHGNVLAAIAGLQGSALEALLDGERDVYLAYLPLAHVLEFSIECYGLFRGVPMGYGTPRTLTDASMRNCKGDIKTLRPTVLAGVPAVWDGIMKAVDAKVRALPLPARVAFRAGLAAKQACVARGVTFPVAVDRALFGPVRAETGGRLRLTISGGAPLSGATQGFVSAAICPLLQGYGMTESTGMTAVRIFPQDFGYAPADVGAPMPCCEIKLVSFAEGGYDATARPARGEVWIRGPSVTKGYYKQPEQTADALTSDGWLRTGDIAELHEGPANGSGEDRARSLRIIDRRKNLVKLAHGEYIALEKLEAIYGTCHYLSRVCVYADAHRAFPLIVANANPPALRALAASLGIAPAAVEWEALVAHPQIVAGVVRELTKIARANKLSPAETVRTAIIAPDEWTPQNGLLTAAMKLQRRAITDMYRDNIEVAYASFQ